MFTIIPVWTIYWEEEDEDPRTFKVPDSDVKNFVEILMRNSATKIVMTCDPMNRPVSKKRLEEIQQEIIDNA